MRRFRVDWERVHTVDDLKAILQAMDPCFPDRPAISHLLEFRPVEDEMTVAEALQLMPSKPAGVVTPSVAKDKECGCPEAPCWHYHSRLLSYPPQDEYVCCRCGYRKIEPCPVPATSSEGDPGQTYHGLFAPRLTVRQDG
jgi:hypothetical protein